MSNAGKIGQATNKHNTKYRRIIMSNGTFLCHQSIDKNGKLKNIFDEKRNISW